jgi:hypothetical protein
MSTATSSRRLWWVAGCVGGVAAFALMATWLYRPVLQTISFMLGRPYFADCSTVIKSEGALEDGRYRITKHVCSPGGGTMYVVFLLKSNEWIAVPLLHSVGSPIPDAVQQKDADSYEILLVSALPSGESRLPVTLDATGFPERYYAFRQGRPEEN